MQAGKHFLTKAIPLMIFFLVLVSFTSCSNNSITKNILSKSIPVSVMKAVKSSLVNVSQFSGIIRPKQLVCVSAPVSGKVTSALFEVGDRVNEGDLLFTLDSTEIEDNIAILKEQLKIAEANLSIAEAGVISASGGQYESQKLQLESALKSAEDMYAAAKAAFDDATALFEAGIINRFQYNQTRSQFQQAKNNLESAESAYELYLSQLSEDTKKGAEEKLKQAEASYDMLKLQIESAQKKLQHMRIKSPITGIIASKSISEGMLVSNAMIPYTIMDTDRVQVVLSLTEQVIGKIKKGDCLPVVVSAVGEEPLEGIVATISPAIDEKTLTFPVMIDINNSENQIKPGMTAKAAIETDRIENCLAVPLSSVLNSEGANYVFTVEGGHAQKKQVAAGAISGDRVQILEGIQEGDLLVVKGQQYLKQDDPVKIMEVVFE